MRSRHVTILTNADNATLGDNHDVDVCDRIPREARAPELSDDESARALIVAATLAGLAQCRRDVAELEQLIEIAHEEGLADGVRVGRMQLAIVRETLRRHEKRLAALNAGISDAELVRAIAADRRAISRPWARARTEFGRARGRVSRMAPRLAGFRADVRSRLSAHRSRTPRRAARVSVLAPASDGAPPPPESDPAEHGHRHERAAGGAS